MSPELREELDQACDNYVRAKDQETHKHYKNKILNLQKGKLIKEEQLVIHNE